MLVSNNILKYANNLNSLLVFPAYYLLIDCICFVLKNFNKIYCNNYDI